MLAGELAARVVSDARLGRDRRVRAQRPRDRQVQEMHAGLRCAREGRGSQVAVGRWRDRPERQRDELADGRVGARHADRRAPWGPPYPQGA